MKKDIIQTAKIVLLGAILSLGISYVFAEPWEGPTGAPPGSNSAEVVNVTSGGQAKNGGLAVGYDVGDENGDGEVDGDDVDEVTATGLGYRLDVNGSVLTQGIFNDGLIISTGNVLAGVLPMDNSVNVVVGGKVGVGTPAPAQSLDIDEGTIRARSLSQEENPGISYNAPICADSNGTLILCDAPFNSSLSTSVYTGYVNECNMEKFILTANPSGGSGSYTATFTSSGTPAGETAPSGLGGSGLSRTITVYKSEISAYTLTFTVVIDDADPDIDSITKTYTTIVPKQPEGIPNPPGPDTMCTD